MLFNLFTQSLKRALLIYCLKMAFINLFDNTISVMNENSHESLVTVVDNGDTGFFYVGNVFTPKDFIGKKLLLKFEVIEEFKDGI